MSDADRAYELAQREIAEAARTGIVRLDLSGKAFHALDRLPPEITRLATLETLSLRYTQIANVASLANLTLLENLDLDGTPVNDLSALAGLTRLTGLFLENTKVTDLTPLSGLLDLEGLKLANTGVK